MSMLSSLVLRFNLRVAPWLWGSSWQPWPVRFLKLQLVLVTVIGLMAMLFQAMQLEMSVEKVRSTVVRNELDSVTSKNVRETEVSVLTSAQTDAMNEAVHRLNVPWADLLNDLEKLTPTDIAVLQIEPLVASNALRWNVEAKSHQSVFLYLEKLHIAKTFNYVRIIQFETNTHDVNRPIRFVIEAQLMIGRSVSSQMK